VEAAAHAFPVSTNASIAGRVQAFVFVTVFLDLVGFGIVIPLLPFYVKSMGGTPETIGFLLASFSFTQLVATPFLGRLSDRYGRRRVILVSLLGNAIAMVIFAGASKLALLWLLFVSRILAGATAGNIAACQASIADVTSGDERAKGMGRLGAGIGLGMVIGPIIGGSMSKIGAWAPPLAAAALAIADLVGAFFFMPETRPPEKRTTTSRRVDDTPKPSLVSVLSQRSLLIVLALYFFVFLCMTNLQVALALLVKVRMNWGELEVGRLFGLFGGIGLIIQGFLIGRLARQYGALNLLAFASLLLGAGLGVVGLAGDPIAIVAGVSLIAIGFGIAVPILSTLASTYAGEQSQGAVLGFAQSSGGLARTVGPVWGGYLYAHIGPGAPFAGGSVSALVALVLGVALRKSPPVSEQRSVELEGPVSGGMQ
jgi:MFS family permease